MKINRKYRIVSLILIVTLLSQTLPTQIFAAAINLNSNVGQQETTTDADEMTTDVVTIVGEVDSLRTEDEKHFRLSDGNFIAVDYGMPVHYADEDGNWQDIDNSLVEVSAASGSNTYQIANEIATTAFATSLAQGRLFSTEYNGFTVSMSLLESTQNSIAAGTVASMADSSAGFVGTIQTFDRTTTVELVETAGSILENADDSGWEMEDLIPENFQSTLLYEDVFTDIDLRYTAYGYNIKEEIIVNAPQSSYNYYFNLELEGLTPQLNEDGSVSLIDSTNTVIYSIPAPFVEDSAGVTSYDAVSYSLLQKSGSTILSVQADTEWMNDSDRVYPIYIDPTLFLEVRSNSADSNGNIYGTYLIEGHPDEHQGNYRSMFCGYSSYTAGGTEAMYELYRVLVQFNVLPSIPEGSIVNSALFNLYMKSFSPNRCAELPIGAYEVTGDKPASTASYGDWLKFMTWNTQPAYDNGNMLDYVLTSADTTESYIAWDITELVKRWYAEGDATAVSKRVIELIATNESELVPSYCAWSKFIGYSSSTPPVLVVSYRNNTGIEPYYTYTTMNAGSAGSTYIADATGQLKIANEVVFYASEVNPVSLGLVYNSDYFADTANRSYVPTTEAGLSMNLGYGWTLDAVQTIELVTLGEIEYIKYTDGDGTAHYFAHDAEKDSANTYYYDEDGLGLEIKGTGTTTYQMSDDFDNTWTFSNGVLTTISDSNGNQILINYTNGQLTSIVQRNNNHPQIIVATLAYTGNTLTSITDAIGNIYSFSYSSGQLIGILRNNRQIAQYSYASGSNHISCAKDCETLYSLNYEWTQGRVSKFFEQANTTTGYVAEISYPNRSQTIYHDYGSNRTKNDSDDLKTYYLFDYAGRTANAYTTDSQGSVIGASNAVYTDTGTTDKQNNRTRRTASIGITAQNLLHGSSFESDTFVWTYVSNCSRSTIAARTGSYGLESRYSTESGKVNAYRSSIPLTAGKTYTLSAYINTSKVTSIGGTGVYLQVSGANKVWTSLPVSNKTKSYVNGGWTRVALTFTAEDAVAHTISICSAGVSGTFYVDDLQLEEGEAPSSRNLLSNGNMNDSGQIWTLSGASYAQSIGMDGSAALMIVGNVNNACEASQTISVQDPSDQTYVLSGWVKANALPDHEEYGRTCGLKAELFYSDSTSEIFYADFNSNLTDWQFTSLVIVPENAPVNGTITEIKVSCVYANNANIACFDNISLVQEPAQTMKYDADGNLVSVSTTGLTADLNTYEGGNLIETVTGGNGTFDYTYDVKHNLTSATDGVITQTNGYSSTGAATSASLSGEDGSKITTSASYTNGDNLLYSVTDALGNTTGYRYANSINQMAGLPSKIIDAKNNETNYTYDTETGRLTGVSTENISLLYGYNAKGFLVGLTRQNSATQSQTYTFSYNDAGSLTQVQVGDRALTTNAYATDSGLLISQQYGNGNVVNYTYDALERLVQVSYNGSTTPSIKYTYNGKGALYKEQDLDNGIITLYDYDTLGRLISLLQYKSSKLKASIYYAYDENSRITQIDYYVDGLGNFSEYFSYSKNQDGLSDGALIQKELISAYKAGCSYDSLMRSSGVELTSRMAESFSYFNNTANSNTSTLIESKVVEIKGECVYEAYYTYDSLGNIVEVQDETSGATVSYTYDSLNQLVGSTITKADSSTRTEIYTYDTAGNILTFNNGVDNHTYTYGDSGWRDLLTAVDGNAITYDGIGNPLSYYNGYSMAWNAARKLTSLDIGGQSFIYSYNTDGIRTEKRCLDGTYVEYHVANGVTFGESHYDTSGNLTYVLQYIFDDNESVCGYSYKRASDTSWNEYYLLRSLQGDVLQVYDGADYSLVAEYEYDAWGNILTATGSHANINPFRYRGYYYDSESGFYYVSSRYYDPEIGRWINADDSDILGVEPGSLLHYNLFAYCWNNPVNMTDDNGYLPWFVAAAAGGALFDTAAYLIGSAISGQKITWAGVGKAALTGAVTGVAFGALGKGVKTLTTAAKATKVGSKVFSLSSKAISKAVSNTSRLQHAFTRHARAFGFGNWNKTTAKQWECFIRGNLSNYTKKFSAKLGEDAVTGYYRYFNGQHIATYIYKSGKYKGLVATVVELSANQMTKYKLW